MRLLLDEHLSPKIAGQLRKRGYDVVAVKERSDLLSREDRVHLASMAEERRAIVTRDLADFRPLLQERIRRGQKTFGIVCVSSRFSLRRDRIKEIVDALEVLLKKYPNDDDLAKAGGEVWLEAIR